MADSLTGGFRKGVDGFPPPPEGTEAPVPPQALVSSLPENALFDAAVERITDRVFYATEFDFTIDTIRRVVVEALDEVALAVLPTEETTGAADSEIERLAAFIVAEFPGEPSEAGSAVDTAIRLLSATRAAPSYSELVDALRGFVGALDETWRVSEVEEWGTYDEEVSASASDALVDARARARALLTRIQGETE